MATILLLLACLTESLTVYETLKVAWTTLETSHEAEVNTLDEALAMVDQIRSVVTGLGSMVEFFEEAGGRSLAIGVGSDRTVVTYQDSLDPPYFISIGDSGSQGVVTFCYGNEETEYLEQNVVSGTAGLSALAEFVEKRMRPECVDWEKL